MKEPRDCEGRCLYRYVPCEEECFFNIFWKTAGKAYLGDGLQSIAAVTLGVSELSDVEFYSSSGIRLWKLKLEIHDFMFVPVP